MIPRVIHYCWFGGRPLPEAAEACLRSWRRYCPGYEIRGWDETTFDLSASRFSQEAAERREWAFTSDFARLAIVHEHGGIYLDTDVELVRPLDDLLSFEAFFGFQQDMTVNTGHGFGAVPRQPVVAALLAPYQARGFLDADGRPDRTPCPQRDTAVFSRLGFELDGTRQERDGVVILPPECFSPKSFHSGRVAVTPQTYAIHHFEASWHSPLEAAHFARMRRYCTAFGERAGRWLYHLDCRARNLAVKCGFGRRWSDEHDHR
jgi:hypothetical protein